MKNFYWFLIVGLLVSSGLGCANFGPGNGNDVVGAPPARLEKSSRRATGVSSEARAIENRLNYH